MYRYSAAVVFRLSAGLSRIPGYVLAGPTAAATSSAAATAAADHPTTTATRGCRYERECYERWRNERDDCGRHGDGESDRDDEPDGDLGGAVQLLNPVHP